MVFVLWTALYMAAWSQWFSECKDIVWPCPLHYPICSLWLPSEKCLSSTRKTASFLSSHFIFIGWFLWGFIIVNHKFVLALSTIKLTLLAWHFDIFSVCPLNLRYIRVTILGYPASQTLSMLLFCTKLYRTPSILCITNNKII